MRVSAEVDGGWQRVRRAVVAAGELVLPARCAACHGPGAPLCRACTAAVRAASPDDGPARVLLQPPPPSMPPCWAGARFEGALRLAVTAYKDEDRRDLRPTLVRVLAPALATSVGADASLRRRLALGERVAVVPMPTARASRRRRGDDPVGALAVAAVAAAGAGGGGGPRGGLGGGGGPRGGLGGGGGLVTVPALVHTRSVADQAHLDRAARAANLSGAIEVAPAWRPAVRGASCVLVDDVVTTGATLAEAARALRAAGARHVVAATVAATTRRLGPPPLWPTGPPTSVCT